MPRHSSWLRLRESIPSSFHRAAFVSQKLLARTRLGEKWNNKIAQSENINFRLWNNFIGIDWKLYWVALSSNWGSSDMERLEHVPSTRSCAADWSRSFVIIPKRLQLQQSSLRAQKFSATRKIILFNYRFTQKSKLIPTLESMFGIQGLGALAIVRALDDTMAETFSSKCSRKSFQANLVRAPKYENKMNFPRWAIFAFSVSTVRRIFLFPPNMRNQIIQ